MANQFKGEIVALAEGKEYTLRLDFNTLCTLEDLSGTHAMDILEAIESGKPMFAQMRAFAFAALQHHHPDITLLQAGELVPDFIKGDQNAFARLIVASFPQDAGADGGSGNPKAAKTPRG